ncbi:MULTISPECIES: tripartite tricarboxylate transporter permease [unclassified Thalassospira]|jgi:TctA family transporter|uniref:tripartite tricarboxylate transporter permease n=1 Tax=unclassified Thalassospira TaxID=2648997 RepID=UPI001B29F107|nr:tripartite tricarboxylate transporter permease [Thalassospira sp.]MBO6773415.1 tripartite tricarboxylate transporter permease [Thalassospira sp.]
MFELLIDAFFLVLAPERLMYLSFGVVLGLMLGILPGVGGVAGLALLLPFTFSMDPVSAFAFMLGLASVAATSDTIPAILFGVPGTQASQATVIDGHAMARKGEAGRALSAAYVSSVIGGLFGAALLALTVPALRPIMLYIGSPELLACSVLGISMVAVLSGSSPLRGLSVAGLGIMLSMIGSDPQGGSLRWTFGTTYLYDGLPLLPIALGLFALPELCDLAIRRMPIISQSKYNVREGMLTGARDAIKNIWLIFRCSGLGACLGALPGLGSSIIDWFTYGFAARSVKGARETFGTGDVRGVIAPESANNAATSGALVPTIAFGVPGSASMSILLGAFLIHGLQPGPAMLTTHLDITYSMVWSIAIANILGAGVCFALSGQMSKIATLRYTLIMPIILSIVYLGAFQGNRDWGDLFALLFFGVLGWVMKSLRWPRPPLILGFVLGGIIERYMFISTARYSYEWLFKPIVIVLLALAALMILRPFISELLAQRKDGSAGVKIHAPSFRLTDIFTMGLICVLVWMVFEATTYTDMAALGPLIVGWFSLGCLVLSLTNQIFRRPARGDSLAIGQSSSRKEVHLDLVEDYNGLPVGKIILRAGVFFGWMIAFMISMAIIGLIPTVLLFVVVYMRAENREPWKLVLPLAIGATVFVYVVFDLFLAIPWPETILGKLFPVFQMIPSI